MGKQRKVILWMLTILVLAFMVLFVLGGIGTVELTLLLLAVVGMSVGYVVWNRSRAHRAA